MLSGALEKEESGARGRLLRGEEPCPGAGRMEGVEGDAAGGVAVQQLQDRLSKHTEVALHLRTELPLPW